VSKRLALREHPESLRGVGVTGVLSTIDDCYRGDDELDVRHYG